MNLRPHTLRPTASGWPLVLEGQEEVGAGETEAPPSLPALLPLGQPREGRVPGHKCLDQPSGPEDVLALPSRSHLHTSGPLPAGRPLGLAWSLRTVPAGTSHVAEARTAASCSLAGLAGNSFVWHEQGFEKYFQMSFQHFQVGGFYILEDEAFSFALSTRGSGRTEAVFQPAALYGAAAPATALAAPSHLAGAQRAPGAPSPRLSGPLPAARTQGGRTLAAADAASSSSRLFSGMAPRSLSLHSGVR